MSHTRESSRAGERLMTAEQLAALPDDGKRHELVDGVLKMMSPAGGRHGRIALKFATRLTLHVEQYQLGQTFAAETGFLVQRDPDTVRAPDAAFVSHARLGEFANHPGFLPLAPELAAEVVSPSDRWSDVESKVLAWLRAGVQVVLVIDPQLRTVRTCRRGGRITVYSEGHVDLDDAVPGFRLDVTELFS